MGYIETLKRIREGRTDYRKRRAILLGKHVFATVRVSDENVMVQISKATMNGDVVLASAHSRELLKYGWKGSRRCIPACYLTGLLAGKKARANGIDGCIVYAGVRGFSSRVGACAKGLIDAGLDVPVGEDALPDDDRITGKHIADYARMLKEDSALYSKRFSAILARGLRPEEYVKHFNEVKANIMKGD
ncbi:MAG: 50S ribosomal protein L18 [Candidatus Nitrosocaldus sp.]|nr:50S ribosomal protein L18 [Candidatus Nitrosocaldus sp.]MDW7999924.1 50S ribosomal protein L18 [Candidatus Nitrosocaldus sp.]